MKRWSWHFILIGFAGLALGCSKGKHEGLPGESITKATYKTRLGDRNFVAGSLRSVYKSDDGSGSADATVETYITDLIGTSSAFFGGACQYYDATSCNSTNRDQDALVPMLSSSSSPREALRLRACLALNGSTAAVLTALGKTGLDGNSEGSDDNLNKAYGLFFPTHSMPSTALGLLRARHASWTATYGRPVAWKLSLLAICFAPVWQSP